MVKEDYINRIKEFTERFTHLWIIPQVVANTGSVNEDFKGWLWIPDTDINYPVVQTDNNDTYLKVLFAPYPPA